MIDVHCSSVNGWLNCSTVISLPLLTMLGMYTTNTVIAPDKIVIMLYWLNMY